MSDYPKISIITPSFNQGQYIEQTIQSVLDQGYPNLEYIIIDGGSSDESVDIIKKYESDIAYWVSEKDRGQSHAINKGLAVATGEIINWLNSDDYHEPGCLFKIAEAFKAKDNVEAVLAVTRIVGVDPVRFSTTQFKANDPFYTYSKALIEQPATFFSGEFYRSVGELKEELHLAMDLDLWLKYLMTHSESSIVRIDDIVVNFREHEDSKTVNYRQQMVVERASLLHEIVKGLTKGEGRYRSEVKSIPVEYRKDVIKGCTDFQMYWYKKFKSIRPELSAQLLEMIDKNNLRFKDRIKLFLA